MFKLETDFNSFILFLLVGNKINEKDRFLFSYFFLLSHFLYTIKEFNFLPLEENSQKEILEFIRTEFKKCL